MKQIYTNLEKQNHQIEIETIKKKRIKKREGERNDSTIQ